MIHTLSYHSKNRLNDVTVDTRHAIEDLLRAARARNERLEITGALMFNEGRFAQILEGPRVAVTELFQSIKNDNRHSDVTVVSMGTVRQRMYGAWSMGFVGTSAKAKSYYEGVLKTGGLAWNKLNGDFLNRLLLELVRLDAES